jgi:hypothetical protein
VQWQNKKLRGDKRQSQGKDKGRVISMRAWRAKKRLQYVRGTRSTTAYVFALLNYVILFAAGVSAVISCIPFSGQIPGIFVTWFFATVGSALSLVLHVNRDRFALKALTIYVSCMALSLVAAIVKLHTLP